MATSRRAASRLSFIRIRTTDVLAISVPAAGSSLCCCWPRALPRRLSRRPEPGDALRAEAVCRGNQLARRFFVRLNRAARKAGDFSRRRGKIRSAFPRPLETHEVSKEPRVQPEAGGACGRGRPYDRFGSSRGARARLGGG